VASIDEGEDMRLIILILCALIAACVFAVMFFAIWRSHRRASPERAPVSDPLSDDRCSRIPGGHRHRSRKCGRLGSFIREVDECRIAGTRSKVCTLERSWCGMVRRSAV
jgi:hypothetical protein